MQKTLLITALAAATIATSAQADTTAVPAGRRYPAHLADLES